MYQKKSYFLALFMFIFWGREGGFRKGGGGWRGEREQEEEEKTVSGNKHIIISEYG